MLGIPAVEFEKGRSHSALQILENGKQLHRLNLTATRGQSPHSWALCPCHLAGNVPWIYIPYCVRSATQTDEHGFARWAWLIASFANSYRKHSDFSISSTIWNAQNLLGRGAWGLTALLLVTMNRSKTATWWEPISCFRVQKNLFGWALPVPITLTQPAPPSPWDCPGAGGSAQKQHRSGFAGRTYSPTPQRSWQAHPAAPTGMKYCGGYSIWNVNRDLPILSIINMLVTDDTPRKGNHIMHHQHKSSNIIINTCHLQHHPSGLQCWGVVVANSYHHLLSMCISDRRLLIHTVAHVKTGDIPRISMHQFLHTQSTWDTHPSTFRSPL